MDSATPLRFAQNDRKGQGCHPARPVLRSLGEEESRRIHVSTNLQPPIPYPLLRRHLRVEHALDINDDRRGALTAEPGQPLERLAALIALAVRAAYAAGLPG